MYRPNASWTTAANDTLDALTLKVNPAFQSLIPLQSRGEYMALEQSILAEGCRDPLTVWKGKK